MMLLRYKYTKLMYSDMPILIFFLPWEKKKLKKSIPCDEWLYTEVTSVFNYRNCARFIT